MIETPQIVQTTTKHTAILHLIVPREDIQKVMGPGIREVMSVVEAQGITPTGPLFTHHLHRPTDVFDFEICVPVSGPITAAGRVNPGVWAAMKVARTIYHGNYEGLAGAWGEFHEWITAKGYKTAEDLWECYVVGPETSPDPTTWRTELSRPVVD